MRSIHNQATDALVNAKELEFKPEFNLRQVKYLFVKAVESKFNEELKPQYIREIESMNSH